MEDSTYNIVTVWIYSIQAVIYLLSASIAFFMLKAALKQIEKLTSQVEVAINSNSINQLNALLSLEQQIAERRIELGIVGIAIKDCKNGEEMESLKLKFNEAKQMYLNALDRLCYCVNKDLLPAEDMRLEYRDIIKAAMTDHSEDFGKTTSYRNITKVYEMWADK